MPHPLGSFNSRWISKRFVGNFGSYWSRTNNNNNKNIKIHRVRTACLHGLILIRRYFKVLSAPFHRHSSITIEYLY